MHSKVFGIIGGFLMLVTFGSAACGSASTPTPSGQGASCTPNHSIDCPCPGTTVTGIQVCNQMGQYGVCTCSAATGGGAGSGTTGTGTPSAACAGGEACQAIGNFKFCSTAAAPLLCTIVNAQCGPSGGTCMDGPTLLGVAGLFCVKTCP